MAKVSSKPSSVLVRSAGITPALLTSACSSEFSAAKRAANSRTEARLDTSQSSSTSLSEPVRSEIRARASSPRSRLRTSMCTVAPPRASRSLMAAPIPDPAPVTSTDQPANAFADS